MKDSLLATPALPLGADTAAAAPVPARPLTPYQVLKMLPRDATPAQQDSAIQAWFQPGEVHYSSRPDTLHLPGHGPGRNPLEVNLPQYYRENFFSNDSLFHPEISGGRYGVAGDPVPYTIRGDNTFTALLLLCFFIFVVSLAHSKNFIVRQFKDIFFSHTDSGLGETSSEFRFLFFLVLLDCLLLGVAAYLFVTSYEADTFVIDSNILVVAIFVAAFMAYFLFKFVAHSLVASVFFGGKKNLQFFNALLFITATQGLLLFPAVLVQVYFDINLQNVAYYLVFVVIFTKFLTIYKSHNIFFERNGFFLQNILYFCALEIAPLLAFGGALMLIVDLLKINY